MSETLPAGRIGILGGGQLARMLAEAAHRLGLEPRTLSASPAAAAAQVAPAAVLGGPDDPVALGGFVCQVAVARFV
jgi:5-(carboxyamino)imidazole ribonucleotide synthase